MSLKVVTLVKVEDVQHAKHAKDLDQFCNDGGGSRIVNRNGMCPFSEIVLDEPEDSSFDGMIWHTQDIYSNHLPWMTNQNIG